MDVDSFVRDGNVWLSRTISQFLAECPFLSPHLVRTALKRLENEKLIMVNRSDTTGKLRMAASDADEAIAFDKACQTSKTKIGQANCERMCQSKVVAMQMYYDRAMPWYHKYIKAVRCDRAELIDYIKVA